MKETDYKKIVEKYDNNKFRQDIKLDIDLKEFIESSAKPKLTFLDLSCGTGIYLSKQMEYFKESNIEWHALDASQDMLEKARSKTTNALYTKGFAEQLPFDPQYFDFIVNNYAFHHYQDKPRALNEAARVAKKDSVFKMHNISIQDMKKWWIYEFFPSAYFEDIKRFWQKELIFRELGSRGFDVKIRMEYKMVASKISEFMDYVYNRDISVLTLINEDEYNEGLEKMNYMIRKNPEAIVVNDFAEIFIIATKK